MRTADFLQGFAVRLIGSVRPTVGMFLCLSVVFVIADPGESFTSVMTGIGLIIASYLVGARIGPPRFAGDATDAAATLAAVLLLLDAFASGGRGAPPVYVPPWLGQVWQVRVFGLLEGLLYAALPQGYAYLLQRLRALRP
jgi:hypothetical protein